MKKINILPPSIFNLLSAGEVVENPAAIVKECIENSIDAGATRIEVEITRGGLDRIVISDNGCGVAPDEIEKVFMPHATSKISSAKDLDGIETLGFRGEAMSSIAAVSMVDFVTSAGKTATAVRLESGKIISQKSVARAQGTTVIISDLFYNTPARAKFLRTPATEKNAVTKVVQGFMLANPHVALRYTIDEDTIYDYHGKSLSDAIYAVYGDVPLLPLSIGGFVGTPDYTKRNRTFQIVIVNGRVIEDELICAAANAVFANFMTTGNFPFFVIDMKIDFKTVDVNVHPRKAQIKFSNPDKISALVRESIGSAIDKHLETKHTLSFDQKQDDEFLKRLAFFGNGDNQTEVKSADHIMNRFDLQERPVIKHQQQEIAQTKSTQKFNILGTIFNTYILLDDGARLHILDQHAAHERLLYDKLSAQIDNGKVMLQRLLSPAIMMLSADEMNKMEAIAPTLNKYGIECEVFGTNSFRITAVPVVVSTNGIDTLVEGLLSDIKNLNPQKLSTLIRDKIIKQCCVAAIKGGDKIDPTQIKFLMSQIAENKTTLACPHGRPIAISFTRDQIEKLLARK